MKIYGIIMEINPFHNGHIHFLNEVRTIAKDNPIICIISTNFVQRGEASVLTKDIKTKCLLENGVDIVVELPMVFANQGGEYFAYHAINILKEFNITDLCFGSETNNKELLNTFVSKTAARTGFQDGINSNLNTLQSNDILAISYIKAINKINPNIETHLIKRIENNYNDLHLANSIASASAIRHNIDDPNINLYLPKYSHSNIQTINKEIYYSIFKLNLDIALNKKMDIFLSEKRQLLFKLKKELLNDPNITYINLLEKVKDKNNSKNKFQRIILNTILLLTDSEMEKVKKESYLRVLGINEKYFYLLKGANEYFTSFAQAEHLQSMQIEKRASTLYNLIQKNNQFDEYNKKPLIKGDK